MPKPMISLKGGSLEPLARARLRLQAMRAGGYDLLKITENLQHDGRRQQGKVESGGSSCLSDNMNKLRRATFQDARTMFLIKLQQTAPQFVLNPKQITNIFFLPVVRPESNLVHGFAVRPTLLL
jgi:hypothetical protein